MGIAGAPVCLLFRHRFGGPMRVFTSVCVCDRNGPVVLLPEVVAGGDRDDEAAVRGFIAAGRVCPDTARAFALFHERYGVPPSLRGRCRRLRPLP